MSDTIEGKPMLALIIFGFLIFCLMWVGVWFYYSNTPKGILEDTEAQAEACDIMKAVAVRAQYVKEAQEDINKAMNGSEETEEYCDYCGHETDCFGNCCNPRCEQSLAD